MNINQEMIVQPLIEGIKQAFTLIPPSLWLVLFILLIIKIVTKKHFKKKK